MTKKPRSREHLHAGLNPLVATVDGSGWGVTADLVIFGRGDGWLYGFRRRLAQSQQGCHGGDVQLRKDTVETAARGQRLKTGGKPSGLGLPKVCGTRERA